MNSQKYNSNAVYKMKYGRMFVAVAAFFATAGMANAGVIASGPTFMFGQDNIICHVTNIAPAATRNVVVTVRDRDGAVVASTACGNLALNGYCIAVASNIALVPHSCTVTTADEGGTLRGNIEVRGTGAQTVPLR